MADVNAEIGVSIDTSNALSQLKNLQRQISQFHTSVAKSSEAAALAQKSLQKNLLNNINAIGAFSAELRTVKTTSESFTASLEGNKFSMREYFRYAGASTKSFGKLFKSEFDTIGKVAEDRVKKLQTQYIKLGRDSSGAMKAIAVIPDQLDLNNHSTKLQLAAQRQAIFNQLIKQGSTNLLNFGKNTQWAGRQLMVGFSIPLMAVGSAASKTFMEMETQAIRFKKVYGDLFTPQAETQKALTDIQNLAKGFTQYGVAASETVKLAADAAAAGFQGIDLQNQTTAATRLSILGQIDNQKALETTISLQNAFGTSSAELASNIDFLNAVENQTVTSLDDITTAIPKAAPVVKQLGGNVKDLAFFLTAMKEGGINASEGANALKSGLASMINPTKKASAMLADMGININNIVERNRGDLKKTVIEFASALNQLDPLSRARAIEQMFGKFQFARISTLFQNITQTGTQAARVLDLAGASVQDLANLSDKELGITADSAMNKFKKAIEDIKVAIIPVGKAFLEAVTPIINFASSILEKFNGLSDGTKKFITLMTVGVAGIGPILLMTFGLLANGIANIIKLFLTLRQGYLRLTGQSKDLGQQTQYLTTEQLDAAAVAHSLGQSHATLTQTFTVEAEAVNALRAAYESATRAAQNFAMNNPGMMMPTKGKVIPKKMASGGLVKGPGNGTSDSIPAMLSNGESVIPAKQTKKYGGLISGIIADNIPGFKKGIKSIEERTKDVPVYPDLAIRYQGSGENQAQRASVPTLADILGPLTARVGEARGLGFGADAKAQYPSIIEEYTPLLEGFLEDVKKEFDATAGEIADESERLAKAWQKAGANIEADVNTAVNSVDQGVIKKALGIETDSYGTVAANFRASHGFGGRAGRYQSENIPTSYTDKGFKGGASHAYELISGEKPTGKDLGHIFDLKTRKKLGMPTTIPMSDLVADAKTSQSAINELRRSIAVAESDIENKIKAQMAATKRSGAQVAEDSVKAVNKAAGTQSPSKKTRKTGQDIARGLQVGMQDEQKKTAQVAGKLADSAVEAAQKAHVAQTKRMLAVSGVPVDAIKAAQQKFNSMSEAEQDALIASRMSGAKPRIIPERTPERLAMLQQRAKNIKRAQITNRLKSVGSSFGGRLGGGTALLGANMAMSALPDFAGKNLIQSTMTGANMGMLFGPWGAAAGAAIGLVSSALGDLIAKEKAQKAMAEAVFKSSADLATYFGNAIVNTDATISRFNVSLGITGTKLEDAGKNFGYSTDELKKFIEMVNSLPKDNPLKNIIDGLTDESNPGKINKIAKAFITTQVALGQIKPDQAQKTLDLILGASDHINMVGSSFINLKTQTEAISTTLKNAGNNTVALGTSLTQMMAAAGNSTSLQQLTGILDGVAASGISAAQALSSMYYAYLQMGNIQGANAVQALERVNNITARQSSTILAAVMKGMNVNINAASQGKDLAAQAEKFLKNPKLWSTTSAGGVTGGASSATASGKAQIDLNKAQIKILKDKKKIIDDQLKQEQKITQELKAQYEYNQKQQDLDQRILDAKIKGNYIEAANLLQQKRQNTLDFKQEQKVSALQAQSDAIQAQIDALQAASDQITSAINATTSAVTAAGNNIVSAIGSINLNTGETGESKSKAVPVPTSKQDLQAYINQYKPRIAVGAAGRGAGSRVATTNDFDPAKAWTDSATKDRLESYLRQRESEALKNLKDGSSLFVSTIGSDGSTYTFKLPKNKGLIRIAPGGTPGAVKGKALGGLIKKYNSGGLIVGPGTGTSDSIIAGRGFAQGGSIRVSNGEYIMKAAAVQNYGVPVMNSINNGTANVGTTSGSTVYNIDMTINGGNNNAKEIADQVMKRLSLVASANNKTNRVGI